MSAPMQPPAPSVPKQLWVPLSPILALVVTIICIINTEGRVQQPNVTWLSSEKAGRLWKGGTLEFLKNKILTFGPVAKLMPRPKLVVHVNSQVTECFDPAYAPQILRGPVYTNDDGQTACVLTREELKHAQRQLGGDYVRNRTTFMALTAGIGMRCTFSSGSGAPGPSFSGVTLDVRPKVEHGQFKLFARGFSSDSFTATPPFPIQSVNTNGMITNISVCCQATVPNGGALVIRRADPYQDHFINYWIISIRAVDSKGSPIELRK